MDAWIMKRTLLVVAIALLGPARVPAAGAGKPAERLQECASACASVSSEAEIIREICLRAVDNAFAARRDAEAAATGAIKSGRASSMRVALDRLSIADHDTTEALTQCAEATDSALVSVASAEAVKTEVKGAAELRGEKEVEEATRRAEKLTDEARRSLAQATVKMEFLKRKWLLPGNLLPKAADPEPPHPRAPWWRRLFGRS
jgi:hypothetical protein